MGFNIWLQSRYTLVGKRRLVTSSSCVGPDP